MKIVLPRKVLMIINNLQFHGYEAFAVGGHRREEEILEAVRDR